MHRWVDYLPIFVSAYNNRFHSTTRQRPLDLVNDPLLTVSDTKEESKGSQQPLPPIGSLVRLNKLRGIFGKESSGTWTREVFRVIRHKQGQERPMLVLEDLMGEPIRGAFYLEEVQQVEWDKSQRRVYQVLGKRRKKGKEEYLVSYEGWPKKFSEWTSTKPDLFD